MSTFPSKICVYLLFPPILQYYYNSVTQSYMYWDSTKSTYLPAPADAQGDAQSPPGSSTGSQDNGADGSTIDNEEDRKDAGKNKMAKKVRMLVWFVVMTRPIVTAKVFPDVLSVMCSAEQCIK